MKGVILVRLLSFGLLTIPFLQNLLVNLPEQPLDIDPDDQLVDILVFYPDLLPGDTDDVILLPVYGKAAEVSTSFREKVETERTSSTMIPIFDLVIRSSRTMILDVASSVFFSPWICIKFFKSMIVVISPLKSIIPLICGVYRGGNKVVYGIRKKDKD